MGESVLGFTTFTSRRLVCSESVDQEPSLRGGELDENSILGRTPRPNFTRIGPMQLVIYVVKKPPCWRAKVALKQEQQRKLPFNIMYALFLSCSSASFALQRDGFVPREWLAAKRLYYRRILVYIFCFINTGL